MIAELMKRDPALRFSIALIAFPGLAALIFSATGLVVVTITCVLLCCTLPAMHLPENVYLSALPVRLRDIYTARVIITMTTILIAGAIGSWRTGEPAVAVMAGIVSLMTLAAEWGIVRGWTLIWWNYIACLPAIGVAEYAAIAKPQWARGPGLTAFIWVCIASVIGLFFLTRNALPQTLQAVAEKRKTRTGKRWFSMPMWFIVYPWRYMILPPLLFLQSATGNPIMSMFGVPVWLGLRAEIGWLSSLPVSRRRLLLMFIVPVAITMAVGPFAFSHIPGYERARSEIVPPNKGVCGKEDGAVPLDAWEVARNGQAATIQSPWGESYQPPPADFFGLRIYNPYAAGCDNTAQFYEWQRARARVVRKTAPPFRRQTASVIVTITIMLLLLLLLMTDDWYKLRRLTRRVRLGLVLGGIAIVAGATGVWGFFHLATRTGVSLSTFDPVQWLVWSLPGYRLLLSCIPVVLIYLGMQKIFSESELPVSVRKT